MAFGHDSNSAQWFKTAEDAEAHRPFKEEDEMTSDPIRITPGEASALQSYPSPFEWRGAKTKQFLQIGNAVPPLLARRVLEALWEPAA